MANIPKSEDELWDEFWEQLAALRASNRAFDAGQGWEAKRIASTVYIMCHDTSRSKSLLGTVGIKSELQFSSTCIFSSAPDGWEYVCVEPGTPLLNVRMQTGKRVEFVPAFHPSPPQIPSKIPFDEWWNMQIFHPTTGITLTRNKIIQTVRSKDGGAHVDDHLSDQAYHVLRTVGDPSVLMAINDGEEFGPGNLVWPIVRQIGWELIHTITNQGE